MAAYSIQQQLKGLRVEGGRRKSRRDPFADDDSDEDNKERRSSRSQTKQSPPAGSKTSPAKGRTSIDARAAIRDGDDDFLNPPKKTSERRPSPAPAQLPITRVTDGAVRRGSLDKGLQSKGLLGRGAQTGRNPRSAVAQAAGSLALLDDSEDEDDLPAAPRANRYPSPAPRKQSDPDPVRRASTPKGSREPPKDPAQAITTTQPSVHTVASPFAGTKYLQDSDSDGDEDEEAVGSRKSSTDEAVGDTSSPERTRLEVKRTDKPKQQHGGGVSWRAFSVGRAEQRNTEIEALQTSLKQRGKSISFGSHAVTDDGNRVPVTASPEQLFGGPVGRRKPRGKSPPRRAGDVEPTEDEVADGGSVGIYDPTQYKTNPFTG